jgi:quinol-cytochrome oxidoreductase complex cytochrome b subunit
MPLDTILVVIAVTMMFVTFALVLNWGDRKTRKHEVRRPF